MEEPIYLMAIIFDDDDRPDERLVQIYVEQITKRGTLTMPTLIKAPNGRFRPLDADARAKVDAAIRCGETEISAYTIDDPGPEKLQELRRNLKADRLRSN